MTELIILNYLYEDDMFSFVIFRSLSRRETIFKINQVFIQISQC